MSRNCQPLGPDDPLDPLADRSILCAIAACSIWCVELLKREIKRAHPEAYVNAILIDFYLYDTMKRMEADGNETIPHHRTRSIWY